MEKKVSDVKIFEMTEQIVCAIASNNNSPIRSGESVKELIDTVFTTLEKLNQK